MTSFSQDETFLDQFDDLVRDQERIELGLKDERNRLEREGEEEGGVEYVDFFYSSLIVRCLKLIEWSKSGDMQCEKTSSQVEEI